MSLPFRIVFVLLSAVAGLCVVTQPVIRAAPAENAKVPKIVFAIGEDEYHAKETLPEFARTELEGKLHFSCVILQSDDKSDLPGLEALKDADLLVMFMRRRTLPDNQLKQFQAYFDSGRPVVGLRTACHSFQTWLDFDKVVLGCHYNNHYGAKGTIRVSPIAGQADDPLLRGVTPAEFESNSSLYRVLPLADTCKPFLTATWQDKTEPVAWTNTYKGGRIFFTTLGHPDDFKLPQFRKLLTNGVLWALDKPMATK